MVISPAFCAYHNTNEISYHYHTGTADFGQA
jgi:hypothetical protein